MKKLKRIICILVVSVMFLGGISDIFPQTEAYFKNNAYALGETSESTSNTDTETDQAQQDTQDGENTEPTETDESYFAFPDSMKAFTVTAGKDFFNDDTQSYETTEQQIDAIISDANELEMNTIVINISNDGKGYYSLDPALSPAEIAIQKLVDEAKKNLFYVYIVVDMNFILSEPESGTLDYRINYLTQIVYRSANNYLIDGVILDGYYNPKTKENYKYYSENGSGIGFENWLLDNGAYVFSLISKSIHNTNSTIPVGIEISNAWANSSTDSSGSSTNDSFEALKDGYSDTVGYLKNGYADFIYLKASGAIDDPDMPFETVVKWWVDLSKEIDVPMFVCQTNEKMGTSATGWLAEDQILKQLVALEKIDGYKGSSFNSYSDLVKNESVKEKLIKYYNNQINVNSLFTELKMIAPTKTNFTTYEPNVIFQGSYDENFEVYFNDELVKLNDAGNFFYEVDLDVGLNVFKIKSKAKTVTYKITRKIEVFHSIDPTSSLSVEGSTIINVSAVAYKNSTITATLNGKTIKLSQTDEILDDEANSSYVKYVGSFEAPKGIVGKTQQLGNIVFNGTYNNVVSAQKTGGRVTINALPENMGPKKLIQIIKDNTPTYEYYTTSKYTAPSCPRLPAGTLDYYTSIVTYNGTSYYLTESKKRIKTSDATIIDGNAFGDNTLTIQNSYVSGNDTVIEFKLDKCTPFDFDFSPLSYYTGSKDCNYFVKDFTPTELVIEFDYVTSVSGTPTFSTGSIFTGARWTESYEGDHVKQQLHLSFAKSGIFAGVSTNYSSDGTLTMRFNGYPSSISQSVIVIDPGHGIVAGGFDHGAIGPVTEQSVNIAVAKKLAEKLKAEGASVYMLPTGSQYFLRSQRPYYALSNYKPDLYISIHCNGTTNGEGVRGTEVHYFTPYSQPLATTIVNNLSNAWGTIYGDGKNHSRGVFYSRFEVILLQDFPSVLVELGFVTDTTEAMKLYDSSNQDLLASAITKGVKQYFQRKN